MITTLWLVLVAGPSAGGPGHVAYVTERRAYLDQGSAAGLARGQSLPLFRDGRPAGSCTVESVAAHSATCTGGRPRPGDLFRTARPVQARPGAVPVLPPLLDQETLAASARAIADAEIDKVAFSGHGAFGLRQTAAIGGGYDAWTSGAAPGDSYLQQRVDGAVRMRLGDSRFRLDAAFTALRWQSRPDRTRFRPGDRTQFLLWAAEVSRREAGESTVVAVGRLWPWYTPGLSVLDGFQIGRQNRAGTVEWGAYGGMIPDAMVLLPQADAWAGGLYGVVSETGARDALVRLARQQVRVGVRHQPGVGTITEAEGVAQAWLGAVELGAGGRARVAAGQPALERAQLAVRLRPDVTTGLIAEVRYFGPSLEEEAILAEETPVLAAGYHAALYAHHDLLPWVGLGASGSLHHDRGSALDRRQGTLELRLPHLLGEVGGASLGAEAAQGWLPGRGVYAQVLGRLDRRVRLLVRGDALAYDGAGQQRSTELGGAFHLDAALASWFHLGARAVMRVAGNGPSPAGPGGVFSLDAAGAF
jgi:hypothetical protein